MPTYPSEPSGYLTDGWGAFYAREQNAGNPHLRTYTGRQAEKFYETFAAGAGGMPRPGKASLPPRPESLTWGMGGTLPNGRMRLQPFPSKDFANSQKRYLVPNEAVEMLPGEDLGRKRHVYDAAGADLKDKRSAGFVLEDVMQRKQRVPEEMRVAHRDIHRPMPPGLKGYMGAEYSNNFFTEGRGKASEMPVASNTGKTKKTFSEKRMEEEVAEQVALVSRLFQPVEDDDEEDAAPAPAD